MKKTKSIRSKIISRMSLTILLALLVSGLVSSSMSYIGTMRLLEQTLAETTRIAAERVEQELTAYANISWETGCVVRLANPQTSLAEKQKVIDQRVNTYGFQRGNVLDTSGKSIFDGKEYTDREYFQTSIQGKTCVSQPIVSKVTGELSVIISAPIWKDGIPDSTVVGVVYFVPQANFLNDIVSSIEVSENSIAYMIDRDGNTIAHKQIEKVSEQENIIQAAKTDASLEALAALEQDAVNGKTGCGSYSRQGERSFLSYAPIEGSGGWSIIMTAPVTDFTASITYGILMTILITIIAILVSVFLARRLAVSISKPLAQMEVIMEHVDEGDLEYEIDYQSQDEIGLLADKMRHTVSRLQNIIADMDYCMSEMAQGNFLVKSRNVEGYQGDYKKILFSMRGLRDTMTDTLAQINEAAEQVDTGSQQVASGAQALSQGATEQASATEELAATANMINTQVQKSGDYAVRASGTTGTAGEQLTQCNQQMQEMLSAMHDISVSSEEIGKIIKAIEDIAFQTNILALNAAVEAARAGSAGKGFAVVADEVRNLAAKSAEASQNTASLIENSMEAVKRGVKLANNTAENLKMVAESSQEVAVMVNKIAASSKEEMTSIQQVATGLNQISAVVQTNSATAEQAAAASEELSGQAAILRSLIGKFKLSE